MSFEIFSPIWFHVNENETNRNMRVIGSDGLLGNTDRISKHIVMYDKPGMTNKGTNNPPNYIKCYKVKDTLFMCY